MPSLLNISVDAPLIAQEVTCYYPISDVYAPTPRYLYYALLVLSFITPRHGWVAHIIFGAAVAYAATASIQAFILLSAQLNPPAAQNVTIPYIDPSNLTTLLNDTLALVAGVTVLPIQPDYLELDIDAVTCIVITAYLVGLPLQCWSSTARTSQILHLLILFWNIVMLAGSISVLILWPNLNVSPPQYRFCFAGVDDGDSISSEGWDSHYWQGSWNATMWSLFGGTTVDNERWINYTTNCLYPCFNTSQILREPTRLRATVLGLDNGHSPEINLHTWATFESDESQPLIYAAIAVFSAAHIFLLVVGRLHLCTPRVPIYRPLQLWTRRREIFGAFAADVKKGWSAVWGACRNPGVVVTWMRSMKVHHVARAHRHPVSHFVVDLLALLVLVGVMVLGPVVIILFIVWIEKYIHADGEPTEQAQSVGQWAFIVQIGLVLLAAFILRFRYKVATDEEVRRDIESARLHLQKLEDIAELRRVRDEGLLSNSPRRSWSALLHPKNWRLAGGAKERASFSMSLTKRTTSPIVAVPAETTESGNNPEQAKAS